MKRNLVQRAAIGTILLVTLNASIPPDRIDPLAASQLTSDPLSHARPMAASELDDLRGGFTWDGLDISMGADVRTYIDGALALQTIVNWTDTGVTTEQQMSAALSPVDAAMLSQGIYSGNGIRMNLGGDSLYLANGGQTAIVHDFSDGLQNIVVNRASGITLDQQVDIALDLDGYESFGANATTQQFSRSIEDMAAAGAWGSLGL